MACLSCGRELHDECCKSTEGNKCCCVSVSENKEKTDNNKFYKADDEIGISAGRKRAANEYKIYPEKPCEWRWKKNCGGGKHPIIGCLGGMQEARHHGPVKNTSRNEETNVHLICTACHNRWHTLNDPDYDEKLNNTLPHSPVPASLDECSQNELKWKSGAYKSG